ncbi:MAG: hypothetical protein EOO48_01145 [Flavobacterium sp.]|nr:MAG: hypothetical protein EOO48_01145 [Flavobacterium sp.]
METNDNGNEDREDSIGQQSEMLSENTTGIAITEPDAPKFKGKHQNDHHINRKYRLFSNHSSYGDSPHTNTSF